jgi:hypothetical protein
MLWALVALLLLFWVGGLFLHILGGFIHVLLVLALVVAAWNLVAGARSSSRV